MQQFLNVKNLGELDNGAAGVAINAALARVFADLEDRGEDQKDRQVEIRLRFRKLDNGQLAIGCEVGTKAPTLKTATTFAGLEKNGKAIQCQFNGWSPDNPNQGTIDQFLPEDEE